MKKTVDYDKGLADNIRDLPNVKEENKMNSRKGVMEFLSRPRELEKEIRNDIDHIASLRSIVENTTTKLSLTSGRSPSRNERAFEETMLEITEEERKLENKVLLLAELKKKNEELICSLENPRCRRVLRMHYIDGLTWRAVAERLNITERHAYYLSKKAHDELLHYMGGS